jgi:hypothetical protein
MTEFICKPPVGNSADRNSRMVWPTGWRRTNPFLNDYKLDDGTKMGCHTGVDLLRRDTTTRGQPVFAIGSGRVVHAKLISASRTWGNVVVIYHGEVDGEPLFSRYAHLQAMVDVTDVDADTKIGTVGSGPANSGMVPHLHFDISTTSVLFSKQPSEGPGHWPFKKHLVEKHYVDPEKWFAKPHTITKDAKGHMIGARQPAVATEMRVVIHPKGVQVRKNPSVLAELIHELKKGTKLSLMRAGAGHADGFTWAQIGDGEMKGFWVAVCTKDQKEFYLGPDK